MRFEHTKVYNFEGAFRGMRNPLNSWDKSDSYFGLISEEYDNEDDWAVAHDWLHKKYPNENYADLYENHEEELEEKDRWLLENGILEDDVNKDIANVAFIGPADMELAQRLVRSGPEHRKFLRQIMVSVDITAPQYIWAELDTYKVGTTANSTSKMHKLASTPITLDCFETDDMQDVVIEDSPEPTFVVTSGYMANTMITWLEELRQKYNETKDKKYWKELIRWLPESWLQTRTVTMNYENILSICKQRKEHKLSEWSAFIHWAKELPYASSLLFLN